MKRLFIGGPREGGSPRSSPSFGARQQSTLAMRGGGFTLSGSSGVNANVPGDVLGTFCERLEAHGHLRPDAAANDEAW